jgi:hypothetical protein
MPTPASTNPFDIRPSLPSKSETWPPSGKRSAGRQGLPERQLALAPEVVGDPRQACAAPAWRCLELAA